MKQDVLSFQKSVMPCVEFNLSDTQKEELDLGKEQKTKQALSIKGGVNDPKNPDFVKIILDLSLCSEREELKLHIVQEDLYEIVTEEKAMPEIADAMRTEAIPESYKRLSSFVRYLTAKAGGEALKMPPYSELVAKNS